MKNCISCGMPMTKPTDHAQRDETKDYCLYCARPDGTMQSYPEKVAGTMAFLERTQGLDEAAARDMAVRLLKRMPIWRSQTPA